MPKSCTISCMARPLGHLVPKPHLRPVVRVHEHQNITIPKAGKSDLVEKTTGQQWIRIL